VDLRRSQRVSEALREELAEIVAFELSDPRLDSVSVVDVQVTADLRSAEVRVLCGDPEREAEALGALERARHFIRRELATRIRLWRMPELQFSSDRSAYAAGRIDQLLHRLEQEREKAGGAA
jgi:ribosome-binding factor A